MATSSNANVDADSGELNLDGDDDNNDDDAAERRAGKPVSRFNIDSDDEEGAHNVDIKIEDFTINVPGRNLLKVKLLSRQKNNLVSEKNR